jgi:hypothetical protein
MSQADYEDEVLGFPRGDGDPDAYGYPGAPVEEGVPHGEDSQVSPF